MSGIFTTFASDLEKVMFNNFNKIRIWKHWLRL